MIAANRRAKAKTPSLILPLKTSFLATKGISPTSFVRPGTATFIEPVDGLTLTAAANQARFIARTVKNLVKTEFNAAGWSLTTATLAAGISDPFGGTGAYTLTSTAPNGFISFSISSAGITSYNMSVYIRRRTGAGIVSVYSDLSATLISGLTSSWKRFSVPDTNNLVSVLNAIRLATSGDAVDIYFPQGADLTGRTNKTPSEYVSNGILSVPYHGVGVDGVKCFATYNGNTVSGNIVTEATGTAIPDALLKGLQFDAAGEYLPVSSANFKNTKGTILLEFTKASTGSGNRFIFGSYVNASNYTALFYTDTQVIFRKRIAGVDYDATFNITLVTGSRYKIAVKWSSNGSQIFVSGTAGTGHSNSSPVQLASTVQVGADGNSANQSHGWIPYIIAYKTTLSDAKIIELITTYLTDDSGDYWVDDNGDYQVEF
jgi:hypothetical protein